MIQKIAWIAICFVIFNTCGGVGQYRETDEKHDEDCAEGGFQLARVKCDKDGEGGREALGMGNCSINI